MLLWAVFLLLWSPLWVQECGGESSLPAAPETSRSQDDKGEDAPSGLQRLEDESSNETETEVARRLWKDQEDRLKEGIESFFKILFPSLVRLGSEAEISAECQAAYFKMFLAVRQLKTWALQSEWPLSVWFVAYHQCCWVVFRDICIEPCMAGSVHG